MSLYDCIIGDNLLISNDANVTNFINTHSESVIDKTFIKSYPNRLWNHVGMVVLKVEQLRTRVRKTFKSVKTPITIEPNRLQVPQSVQKSHKRNKRKTVRLTAKKSQTIHM